MARNTPNFPKFLPVLINILIAIMLSAAFISIYTWGIFTAATYQPGSEAGVPELPQWFETPIVGTLLSSFGGFMSALFAVALNLKTSPRPRNFQQLTNRYAKLFTLATSSTTKGGTRSTEDFFESLEKTPTINEETELNWDDISTKALTIIASVLVIAYLLLVVASAFIAVLQYAGAPPFIVTFGETGLGIMLAAFSAWFFGVRNGDG